MIPAGRGDRYWSPVGPPEPADTEPSGDDDADYADDDGGDAGANWRLFWWGVEDGKRAAPERSCRSAAARQSLGQESARRAHRARSSGFGRRDSVARARDGRMTVAETRKVVMRPLTWVLIAVGVVALGVGAVYFTTSAAHLPAFFPGHQAGVTKTHTKHGLVMLGLAIVAFLGAWFTTAPGSA